VTTVRCWRDVWSMGHRLTDLDQRIINLLGHLPFLWPEGVTAFLDRWGMATVYGRLRFLEEAALLASVRVVLDPGRSPRFYHLTDQGLAVLAAATGRDPVDLARENRIRGSDLRALLPSLAQLRSTYRLLIALATSRPGRPDIVAWDRCWRPGRTNHRGRLTSLCPARVILSWDGINRESFLLVADRGCFPIRTYQDALRTWLRNAEFERSRLLPLIVATASTERALAWDRTLGAVGWMAACRDARIVTWDMLSAGDVDRGPLVVSRRVPEHATHPAASPPPPVSRASYRLIPRPVRVISREPNTRPGVALDPAEVTSTLTPADRSVLDLIGRHPFLDRHDLEVWPTTLSRKI